MFKKSRTESVKATVKSIDEVSHANPTMASARNVPLASIVNTYRGVFTLENGDELKLAVSEKLACKLRPGMCGTLKYKDLEAISFA